MHLYVNDLIDCQKIVDELFSQKFEFAYSRKNKLYYIKVGSGFDIETTNIIVDEQPIFAYAYHWQFSFSGTVIMGRLLEVMVHLFRCFADRLRSMQFKGKKCRLLVFNANLGFEFQFCKKYWYPLGLSEFFCKEPRNPLKITIADTIEIRECIGLFGKSLSHIAKNYCKTQKLKGDLDYSILRHSNSKMTKQEIKYCINDVLILSELGEYVFTICFGKFADLPLTSTGFIRNAIKKRIGARLQFVKQETFANLPDGFTYVKQRRYCFKGGLCGSNDLYSDEIQYYCFCADLTSDYPAQMFHKYFPYGKLLECPTSEFMRDKNVPYIAHVVFYGMQSKTTHSILSCHKAVNEKELKNYNSTIDNGRIWQADIVETYINDIEYRGLLKAYEIENFEVLECWKFGGYRKAPKYLLDELREQYKIKSDLKMRGLHELPEYADDYRTAKEFCNGIYGMCATSIFPDEKYIDPDDPEVKVQEKLNCKTFEEACVSMFLSPYIAFWVTSYARNILIDFITDPRFSDIIIQYDTDSLYFIGGSSASEQLLQELEKYNEKLYKMNEIIFDHDEAFKTLGTWDIEKPILRFKGMGAKRYMKQYAGNSDLFRIKYFKTFWEVDFMERPEIRARIECHAKHLHRKTKLVCVGCKEQGFFKQFKEVSEYKIFDCFNKNMIIEAQNSYDLESKYIDSEVTCSITDYAGNTEICTSKSCVVLKDSAYSMKLSPAHIDFILTLKEDAKNENQIYRQ